MPNVITLQCPKCKDRIYSRARHDFRTCTCGLIFVDGGFDYVRAGFMKATKLPFPTHYRMYIKALKKELYDDWNESIDKYGIIKEEKEMKCERCNRELSNKDLLTKDGCKWCDTEYQRKIKNEKK